MNEETTNVEEPEVQESEGKGLRSQLETALAKNKAHDLKDKERAFDDAGLDRTKTLGKAIFAGYDGELTKEAVTEFASTEYDWEGPTVSDHPQAQQIAEGQERLDDIGQTAGSVAAPTEVDQLAKAEAEGDYATTLNIKGQQMADMLKP